MNRDDAKHEQRESGDADAHAQVPNFNSQVAVDGAPAATKVGKSGRNDAICRPKTSPKSSQSSPANQAASSYQAALAFLYDRINYERMSSGTSKYPFRLNRMRQLLCRLGLEKLLHGSGESAVPLVHLAGTKGKGSTASMVAAALSAGGIRTGLYTSPHLHRLEERFRIDENPCRPSDIVEMVDRLRQILEPASLDDRAGDVSSATEFPVSPSFFELTTAMAFLHFDTQDCEAFVLEVGLGGRLDSTNVCSPTVTAITPIGLDHQHVLGNTLVDIATEKAGIIKSNVPVVCGISVKDPKHAEVIDVIADRAKEKSAPLYLLDRDFQFDDEPDPRWGSRVTFRGIHSQFTPELSVELSMEGRHQAVNATVAIAIADLLRQQEFGHKITADAIATGVGSLRCEARIERMDLADDVVCIVDAAHNEESMAALCRCIQSRRGDRVVSVVFGTSHDKSAEIMLRQLSTIADHLVLTQYAGNPRFQPTENLIPLVPSSLTDRVSVAKDPVDACSRGLKQASLGGMLVVCGSFFVAAETRKWLKEQEAKNLKS